MNSFGLDPFAKVGVRRHADEMRTDWRLVNARGREAAGTSADPCGDRDPRGPALVGRLLVNLGLRRRLATGEPCS